MSALWRVWRRLLGTASPRAKRRSDAELRAELDALIAIEAEENLRRGMSSDDAWRLARANSGGITQTVEAVRDERSIPMLEAILRDAREALNPRVLRHHRIFSAAIILSIGLGVSSAASVVALIESARHGPLPFRNADRLEHLFVESTWGAGGKLWSVPAAIMPALTNAAHSPIDDAAAYRSDAFQLRNGEHLVRIGGVHATPNFFAVVGAHAVLGRVFSPGDANAPVAVLSYDAWRSAFAGDSTVVGRPLTVDGVTRVIIGVLDLPTAFPDRAEVWTNDLDPRDEANHRRPISVLVLLRPGQDAAQASARVLTIASSAFTLDGGKRPAARLGIISLRDYLIDSRLRTALLVFTVIAVFVGFIAAVNFAALMLARGMRRRGELGVRAALGASVPQLARHLVGECVLLCALGGVLAAVLAPAVSNLITASFAELGPHWLKISLGWRTIAASVSLALLVGVVFGIGPALDVARPALQGFLRTASGTASDAGVLARTRSALVAIQVGLATAVLVTLGSLFGSAAYRGFRDPGFDFAPIIRGTLEDSTFSGSRTALNVATLLGSANELPGVRGAAVVHWQFIGPPRAGSSGGPAPDVDPRIQLFQRYRVSAGFFALARPRLLEGRFPRPDEERRGDHVAVVTRRLGAMLFPGEAVGQRVYLDGADGGTFEVVGVIDDLQENFSVGDPYPTVITPLGATTGHVVMMQRWELWLRSAGTVAATLRTAQVRAAINQLGDGHLWGLESFAVAFDRSARELAAVRRIVLTIFLLALVLAAIGIYGLVAYTAEMRSRELAIREALGASRIRIGVRVVRGALLQAVCGVVAGAALTTILIEHLNDYELKLARTGPPTAAALVVVCSTVLLSSIGPLCATWRRDIVIALRSS